MEKLNHSFINALPEQLEQGMLYVSVEHTVAIHLCPCGCGNQVITPFSPDGWKLTFDGQTISLYPSIGNWNFVCKSHYWIVKNSIIQAAPFGKKESGRLREVFRKANQSRKKK